MKFWEAMKALDEGKKVRIVEWEKREFIYLFNRELCNEDKVEISLEYEDFFDSEWELYEEPQKTYSFMEMIELLKQRKKAKRTGWDPLGNPIFLDPNGIIFKGLCGKFFASGSPYCLTIEDMQATDWIMVEG